MQTQVANLTLGTDQPLTIIAGPCVAESKDLCLTIGQAVQAACQDLGFQLIFKASYDKANRSSVHSARGPGLTQGLNLIADVGQALAAPTTTDIHLPEHADPTASRIDLLQIPAFLSRQTDLLLAAAATGKPVNVKKGQFLSPQEMTNVVTKLQEAHAAGIMLTERGTFFGYNRLVNDFTGLGDLLALDYPVCFDVTHSTQQPGGQGTASGGRPDRAPLLAKAAVAAGVHALFIETHPDPANALSDGATMLPLDATLELLPTLAKLHAALQ
ncbi:MAG: 3-deoxy-8-phosphooctulonate synthase [Planctomycetota bacterium]